jgi:hypothetical protein
MNQLVSKISTLSEWIASLQPHANMTLLLVGVCFFLFGVTRRKTP